MNELAPSRCATSPAPPAIATLDDDTRHRLDALRPPDALRPLTDLPREIRDQLSSSATRGSAS